MIEVWEQMNRHRNKQYKHFRRTVSRFFRNENHVGQLFRTGKGKMNEITGWDSKKRVMYIQTEEGKSPFKMPAKKATDGAVVLLYKRTITRGDLEKVFNFNSSLLGLLAFIFGSEVKVFESEKRILHLTVLGCQFFFSGMDRASVADWIRLIKNKVSTVLMSYFYLRYNENGVWKYFVKRFGIRILLDSGEFTVYRRKQAIWKLINSWQKEINEQGLEQLIASGQDKLYRSKLKKLLDYEPVKVEDLAGFVLRNDTYIFQYVNLDVTGKPEVTAGNQKILYQLTGRKPIPVWHCNTENWEESDWVGLDALVKERHNVIAIGATAHYRDENKKRYLFEEIFKRHPLQNFHALGCSSYLMLEFPFFSADSMGWTKGRTKDDNGFYQVYILQGPNQATTRTKLGTSEERLDFNVKMLGSVHDSGFRRLFSENENWYMLYQKMAAEEQEWEIDIEGELEAYKSLQKFLSKNKKEEVQISLWDLTYAS